MVHLLHMQKLRRVGKTFVCSPQVFLAKCRMHQKKHSASIYAHYSKCNEKFCAKKPKEKCHPFEVDTQMSLHLCTYTLAQKSAALLSDFNLLLRQIGLQKNLSWV